TTWINSANGNWGSASNWSPGISPNGTTVRARLGSAITATRQLNLDTQVTLNQLEIDNANTYQVVGTPVAGSYGMRFGGTAVVALSVASGSHEFQSPVLVDKDAAFDISTGASVRFSNNF